MTTSSTPTPLSGQQVHLAHGRYAATIATVGASLRELTVEGRNLTVPFEADAVRPVFRGAILAPWPNRITDGKYTFDGVDYQVPLTEPGRGHALHGLLAWADYDIVSADESTAVLRADVVPSDGYPFPLTITVTYALSDEGLSTTVEALNTGRAAAPYGTAPHPYLSAGAGHVDDWTLTLPAGEYLEVTDERLLPEGVHPVSSHPAFDFRSPRAIDELFIDHAFTGLTREADGTATVEVRAPEGTGVRITWGDELPWVQVHTADRPSPRFTVSGWRSSR